MPLTQALAVFTEHAKTPHWIVALSGGADSALLLELACVKASELGNVYVTAFYLHHYPTPLERERQRVLNFLAARAQRMLQDRFRLLTAQCDITARAARLGRSWEHAASLIRRRALEKLARQNDKAIIFTGHTLSDYFETLQLRKERRIPESAWPQPCAHDEATGFCRPLYYMSRDEVRHHARARGLLWFDDPTNADFAIARNRIRHALHAGMPARPGMLPKRGESVMPTFLKVHWRELRLAHADWSKLDSVARARLVYRAWQKLGIVKRFTRGDFARARRLPFALPPYFVHEEEIAGTRWIIFRRGLGATTSGNFFPPKNSLRGDEITRALKIRMPYGRKSVTKILSERKLSPRQRRLTRILLNPSGDAAIVIYFPEGVHT